MAQQEPDRAEGRLRARGRVRHVEMELKSEMCVRNSCSSGQWWHTFHITGEFTSVPTSPWAGGIVPSFSRKCTVSCQGICAGQGVLCSLKAVLVFYLEKISAKTGLALPSGELIANMESIEFSMGIQWEFPWKWQQQLASTGKALSLSFENLRCFCSPWAGGNSLPRSFARLRKMCRGCGAAELSPLGWDALNSTVSLPK